MSEEGTNNADNPGVVAPPPLIYLAALAAGLLVNSIYPVRSLPRGGSRVAGLPLVLGGLLIGLLGVREMRRAETNVDPYKPTTAIVERGPYRFTRNPLYVGMTLMYGGFSVLANALAPILLLPAVFAIMRRGVIEREERYLERKFGDEYLEYKGRVRRWI
ncbi:isoprenylcysteine carboxylmethyltransferase family protein [soil metagenome]